MKVKKGIGVSDGYAIAPVKIIDDEAITISQRYIKKENVESEIELFERACKSVVKELNKRVKNFPAILKNESLSIVNSYTQILFDHSFTKEVKELIKLNLYSAPYAVFKALKKYINVLENAHDEFFRSRANDLVGLRNLLIKKMTLQQNKSTLLPREKFIVVAKKFNLASTVNALIRNLVGIITEEGTKTSHAAILAKEFGIPAVTALDNISQEVVDGEIVIVDGFNGNVIINPTDEAIKKYEVLLNIYHEEKRKLLEGIKALPCVTLDGREIKVCANIEFPDEIQNAIDSGADGIGLF
ncbi:MAG: phosphoenolpyruvate-utilizing N-terminal domain-containing protein, partial [Planctomycetota bacterium]